MELMKKAVASSMKKEVPVFHIGDTVNVHVRIVEGEKERVQVYSGTVIARRGQGIGESFTVRRIVNNEGVERIFPVHSPKIASIEIVRGGRVRRAKLYYLRDRVGKSTRLKEIQKGSRIVAPVEEVEAAKKAQKEAAAAAAPAAKTE
jgi:large subunit ribosomal protein L19